MGPKAFPALAAILFVAALALASPAAAAVGVERSSRPAGPAGATVELTLGCGFCFPPCDGPAANPAGGTCMPGKRRPPASFPVSLVPLAQVPEPHRCGPNALCSPAAAAPPHSAPFTLLGEATPPQRAVHVSRSGRIPRYLLRFEIPDRRPGVYAFVIFCDACLPGRAGSLIADPRARPWRLRIAPPRATVSVPRW